MSYATREFYQTKLHIYGIYYVREQRCRQMILPQTRQNGEEYDTAET